MEDGHVSSYKSSMGLSENGVKLFFLLDHHSSNQQMAICTGYTPFSDTQMIRTGHFQRRGHRVRSCHGHRPPIVAEAAPVEGAEITTLESWVTRKKSGSRRLPGYTPEHNEEDPMKGANQRQSHLKPDLGAFPEKKSWDDDSSKDLGIRLIHFLDKPKYPQSYTGVTTTIRVLRRIQTTV